MFKKLHVFTMFVIALSMTFTTTLIAQEKDALTQFRESLANKEEQITILEDLGSDEDDTVIDLDYPVTITGDGTSKFYGSFIIKSAGVTIKNLKIQNQGDLQGKSTTNRSGIYVYATDVHIEGNEFSNGLGDAEGLSNGLQIMSPKEGNEFSKYKIINNTFIGHSNNVTNFTSSAIVVAQGYNPSSINKQRAENIVVSEADALSIFKYNTFINNNIDFTHQDWSNSENPVLFTTQQTDFIEKYKEDQISQLKDVFKTLDLELYQENKDFLEGFEKRVLEVVEDSKTINDIDNAIEKLKTEILEMLSDQQIMEQALAAARKFKTEEHIKNAIDLVTKYHPNEGKEDIILELEQLLEKDQEVPVDKEQPNDDKKDKEDLVDNKQPSEDKKEVDKNKVPHTGINEITTVYLSLIVFSLIILVNLYKRKTNFSK